MKIRFLTRLIGLSLFISIYANAESLLVDEYCLCTGKFEVDETSKEPKYTIVNPARLNSCRSAVVSIYKMGDGNLTELFSVEEKSEKKPDGPICNAHERKEKINEYLSVQKKSENELELRVDNEICGRLNENRDKKSKVELCRESLIGLLSEHEKFVFDQCNEDFKNRGKSKNVSRCVRLESYKLILSNKEASFFDGVCPKEPIDGYLDCVEKMRNKFGEAYYKDEMARCSEANGFSTDKSVAVCKDILISNVLALQTPAEKEKLLKCVKNSSNNDAVKVCVSDYLAPKDMDEKTALDELMSKYCPSSEFNTEPKQKECLEGLLLENLQDFPMSKECSSLRDDVARNKCHRMALYKRLLKNESENSYDCWNHKKFSTMKQREECQDQAKVAFEKVKKCELKVGDERISCLEKIKSNPVAGIDVARKEATRDLREYLNSLGVPGLETCSNQNDEFSCLKKLYQDYKAQQSNSSSGSNTDLLKADAPNNLNNTLSDKNDIPNNSNLSQLSSNENSSSLNGGNAVVGAMGAFAAGQLISNAFSGSKTKIPALSATVGVVASGMLLKQVVRAFKFRKDTSACCKCLRKNSSFYSAGYISTHVSSKLSSDKFSKSVNKDSDQENAIKGVQQYSEDQKKHYEVGNQVQRTVASQAEQCKSICMEESTKNATSSGTSDPVQCGGKSGKTAALYVQPKTNLFISMFNNMKNEYQADLIMDEWHSYMEGANRSINVDTIDINKLMKTEAVAMSSLYKYSVLLFDALIAPASANNAVTSNVDGSSIFDPKILNGMGIQGSVVKNSSENSSADNGIVVAEDNSRDAVKTAKQYQSGANGYANYLDVLKPIAEGMGSLRNKKKENGN